MGKFGVGLDIGTTTIQAQLVNLKTGGTLDTFSAFNNQRSFGADVISRISASKGGKITKLFSVVNNQVKDILEYFIKKNKLDNIEKCVVSGNTTMLHFFCCIDPVDMGSAPYTPAFLEEQYFDGKDLFLPVKNITLLPGISAFVGADITAGLALIDIMNKGKDALFVDIGTNGEMAVWKESEKQLLCCSAAAGPCFEEMETSCGLNASEFIDVAAEMKRSNVIDETGVMTKEFLQTGYPAREGSVVTQKDVRQFQLAKSAIFSGIKMICKKADLGAGGFGAVYIAGGLGLHLNLENAAAVRLLPKEFAGRPQELQIEVCGNTSLKGAVKCLTDSEFLPRCREISSRAETIDLANDKYFSAAFEHNMWF